MLEVPFRWGAFDGCVRVEVGVNADPAALLAADWDVHRAFLGGAFPDWRFAPGFHRHPLRS